MTLSEQKCVPCEGGVEPLTQEDAEKLSAQVRDWILAEDTKQISKDLRFKNFAEALSFVNKVGEIAEQEGHHPDIAFGWGKVHITLATHAIGGLSINDFVLASKIDLITL